MIVVAIDQVAKFTRIHYIITIHIYTSCTIIYYSNNANMINFRFQRLQIHVC